MTLIDVESTNSPATESMAVLKAITAVHLADSRGHFRTSQLSLRRGSKDCSSSAAAGSGWPERHWNHFLPLRTRFRPTLGTVEPKARSHRSKWHHRYPDTQVESSTIGACSVAAPCGEKGRIPNMVPYPRLFFTLRRSRGATGRYQGPTGARSTAPRRSRRRRTVPTPFPGAGKGLITRLTTRKQSSLDEGIWG